MKRVHLFYSGIVQGVGFRYTVQHIVAKLGDLTGWVRNLPDGRVEIVIEGEEQRIIMFMENVESHFEGSIRHKDMEYSDAQGTFSGFRIVF